MAASECSATRTGPSYSISPTLPSSTRTSRRPPRFLPEYDNVLLGHADRSRFFIPGVIPPGWAGNLLVDGMYSGWWKLVTSQDPVRIELGLLRQIPDSDLDEVGEEARRLLRFAHPDSDVGEVVFHQKW